MTINLFNYDTTTQQIDKTKTWIDVKKRKLVSREIKHRTYYSICKKFIPECNIFEYYVIVTDDVNLLSINKNYKFYKTLNDNYGRIKLSIKSIWNDISDFLEKTDVNINISEVEFDDTTNVYKLFV